MNTNYFIKFHFQIRSFGLFFVFVKHENELFEFKTAIFSKVLLSFLGYLMLKLIKYAFSMFTWYLVNINDNSYIMSI